MKRTTLAGGAALLAFLAVAGLCTPTLALDRHVKIVNESGYTIVEFYASSVGSKTWQEDILGSDVLETGYSVNVNIDDGTGYCKYDFRAVFSDGDTAEKAGVNVCEIGTFTFN